MNWAFYARGQFLLSWKVFWRNRRSTMLGFALPVLLDLMIAVPLRGRTLGGVNAAAYTTVGFMGLALATGFVNLLSAVVARRDELVLKRLRGTEVPPTAVFAGQIGAAGAVVLLQSALLGALAVGWFGAEPPADPVLLLLALAEGYVLFAVLAVAVSGLTPSTETAPLVAMPMLLLCMFASGVLAPIGSLPGRLRVPADLLPLAPVVRTLRTAWFGRDFGEGPRGAAASPALDLVHGWQSSAPHLLLLGAWVCVGLALSRRFFRWEPRRG